MRASIFITLCLGLAVFLSATSSAHAGTSDRVSFEISPRVVSQLVGRVEGETTLLVASNSAFSISAKGMIGAVSVSIEDAGNINGTQFGSASQLPGQTSSKTFLTSAFETSIYQANRKTAQSPGAPIDQAVLVRITYAGATHPTLRVEPKL